MVRKANGRSGFQPRLESHQAGAPTDNPLWVK